MKRLVVAGLGWRPPGVVLTGHLADGGRAVVLAVAAGLDAPRLAGAELVAALEQVDAVRARTETVTVTPGTVPSLADIPPGV